MVWSLTINIVCISEAEPEAEIEAETETETQSVWVNVCTEGQNSYLCPFCYRQYTCWGYRRRHIKARHALLDQMSCRWCPNHYFPQALWLKHATSRHSLSQNDALQAVRILHEAIKVLHMRNEKSQLDEILGT